MSIKSLIEFISLKIVSPITFNRIVSFFRKDHRYWNLTEEDWEYLREALKKHYYIILNYRKTHLTTYFIGLGTLLKEGKWAKYTHAFVNVEGDDIKEDTDFKLLETIAKGTTLSSFKEVFDCDSVCLLVPQGMTPKDWTDFIDAGLDILGTPYDTFFDIFDRSKLSCVEQVRVQLQALPEYETRFANFESLIKKHGNSLTPQMIRDCSDFQVVWEVRR